MNDPVQRSTSMISIIATPGLTDTNGETILAKVGITVLGFVVGCLLGVVLFVACPTQERDWVREELRDHRRRRRRRRTPPILRQTGSNAYAHGHTEMSFRQRLGHPEREEEVEHQE